MSVRKLVLDYYKSEATIKTDVLDSFLHPDAVIEWIGHEGLKKMNRQEWMDYTKVLEQSYVRYKAKISHFLVDKNLVSVKYKLYVKIVENPREDLYLADFMTIWEIKDDKIFKCIQMSRPV